LRFLVSLGDIVQETGKLKLPRKRYLVHDHFRRELFAVAAQRKHLNALVKDA
jgi:hypothetical protein